MHDVFQQSCVAAGDAFLVPSLCQRIDAAAIKAQCFRGQRGNPHLAGIAQTDVTPRRDFQQFAFGAGHYLPQGFDCLVPLLRGQALPSPFQVGRGGGVGAVELHGLRKLELTACTPAANLRSGARRKNSAQQDQAQSDSRCKHCHSLSISDSAGGEKRQRRGKGDTARGDAEIFSLSSPLSAFPSSPSPRPRAWLESPR